MALSIVASHYLACAFIISCSCVSSRCFKVNSLQILLYMARSCAKQHETGWIHDLISVVGKTLPQFKHLRCRWTDPMGFPSRCATLLGWVRHTFVSRHPHSGQSIPSVFSFLSSIDTLTIPPPGNKKPHRAGARTRWGQPHHGNHSTMSQLFYCTLGTALRALVVNRHP